MIGGQAAGSQPPSASASCSSSSSSSPSGPAAGGGARLHRSKRRPDILDMLMPFFWSDPQEAIKNAYSSTNKYILENSKQLGPGGSTAIVVDGKDLWIANIGDSRAVVCERGTANQLTVDHEPHTTNERKRIEKQGGFVSTFPGDVPRVNGQLAVARAFGDQSLKAHLSSEPDVKHIQINSSIEFVILASDGLWKVMKNQEAIDLVKSTKDPQTAAKQLTSEALGRMSKDDISCIVIRFRC
ncbi:putative protein phosphatase 2C 44 [Panicum miliaceum]|uniref:protein-serine/threonine phosphatase n=1 Tax=Panicum miliaceum TaxID=4540 RepID=A0A3L6PP35_PANMI|nr:putative protein phosphatase 2C 44 [Panicum miliaceum]